MFAIYKRELKSYFRSFIGFLFVAVTLFFLGLYFSVYNLINCYPYFTYVVSAVSFVFLFSVPVLTMRTLAEEKRSKTDQLILTAPVSVACIVVGKFLALLTIFVIPVIIICFYPLLMSRFGTVPMPEAYLSILAYFLYGMVAIAIGLFISSVTESQVIAAVLGFAVLFLGYMMAPICSLLSDTGNWLTTILGCFDLYTHFGEMLNGTLNLNGIVYYFSLTVLVLFLTVQSIQKRRYSVSAKHLSFGAYSTGMIAISVVVVVVLNLIVAEMPVSWTNIDVTGNKMFSLTEQTKEYVANMQEDVTIYVLAAEDNQDMTLQQTLERYEDLSEHIAVEYVDPVINPRFYMQYTDTAVSGNSLIVVGEKRSKVIDYNNIYETNFDYTTYTSATTGYDGEGQITSALDYVLSANMPKLYMLEGHGEASLSVSFTSGLSKENVEYETINLINHEAVPEDAACVLINGATKDFSEDDKNKVLAYLEQGGKVILVTSYLENMETPNLDAIMEYMGLEIADGLVVETNLQYYYSSPYYLLPATYTSTYTSGIVNNYYLFAPYSQGILVKNEDAEGMAYDIFLGTSDDAFSKISITNMENYDKASEDIDGPFGIGVEAIKSLEEGDATLVVYGCASLFTDSASAMVSGANLTLFTNTVSSFVNHEVSVSVPVKAYEVSLLTVPQASILFWAPFVTVILPVGFLVVGFVIWFKRRKR